MKIVACVLIAFVGAFLMLWGLGASAGEALRLALGFAAFASTAFGMMVVLMPPSR